MDLLNSAAPPTSRCSGIAERQVRMAERQGEQVAAAIASALADPEWGLTLEAQEVGRRVIARHLRGAIEGRVDPQLAMTGAPEEVIDPDD